MSGPGEQGGGGRQSSLTVRIGLCSFRGAVAFDWKASLRLRIELWGLAAAAGTLVWIATLAGFAASLGWLFEIACHFRLQYA